MLFLDVPAILECVLLCWPRFQNLSQQITLYLGSYMTIMYELIWMGDILILPQFSTKERMCCDILKVLIFVCYISCYPNVSGLTFWTVSGKQSNTYFYFPSKNILSFFVYWFQVSQPRKNHSYVFTNTTSHKHIK